MIRTIIRCDWMKTIKILIIFLIIGTIFASGCVRKAEVTKEQMIKKFSDLEVQYENMKSQGYDVAETDTLNRLAKQAYDRGDYQESNELLDEAFRAIYKAKNPAGWINEGPIYETHPYYYDGTFKGLAEKIPEIADLGIKTIYLMPIWAHEDELTSTTIYLIKDYYKIDPVYGTEEDLRELVETVHKHNMTIFFDLVTCCAPPESTPWNNNWIYKLSLLELQEKAKELGWVLQYDTHRDYKIVYYSCKKDGGIKCEFMGRVAGDDVVVYFYPEAKFGPAVDRSNPDVIEYFIKVSEYYVRKYDIDGWRLDTPSNNWNPKIISGDHSSLELMRNLKKSVVKVKPHIIFLAENPSINTADFAMDEISEGSYSYAFLNFVYGYKIRGYSNSREFMDFLSLENEKIRHGKVRTRFVETHDLPRINKVSPHLNKPLLVLISTIPGVPMIQAGQEIGATNEWFYQGATNPQVDWDNGDHELRNFYKKVFRVRNTNKALKCGTIENVWKAGDSSNYAYLRSCEDDKVVVVINFNNETVSNTLNLPFESGVVLHDELNDESFRVNDPNNFKITLPTYGSRILVLERSQ